MIAVDRTWSRVEEMPAGTPIDRRSIDTGHGRHRGVTHHLPSRKRCMCVPDLECRHANHDQVQGLLAYARRLYTAAASTRGHWMMDENHPLLPSAAALDHQNANRPVGCGQRIRLMIVRVHLHQRQACVGLTASSSLAVSRSGYQLDATASDDYRKAKVMSKIYIYIDQGSYGFTSGNHVTPPRIRLRVCT
jgi:hypothetical protein